MSAHLSSIRPAATILGCLILPAAAAAQTTTRVSVSSSGAEANGDSITNSNTLLSISGDGRFVAFNSRASNLVASDTNGIPDVFVRDLLNGTTERASVSSSEQEGGGDNYGRGSYGTSLSFDGRYLAFYSYSPNLVSGDSGGNGDVFVRDLVAGTTERVSLSTGGKSPNSDSQSPSISGDGRYVLFDSYATNLVSSDRNKALDVFVRDRNAGTTQRVSVSSTGKEGNGASHAYFCGNALSGDGRYALFVSLADNLVAGDTNGQLDVFVRDLWSATTERVSVTSAGVQANGACEYACISADGRFVAFKSAAANLAPPGAPAGVAQAYVHDRVLHTTECVSIDATGQAGDRSLYDHLALSADGRFVAFTSPATNLVAGDTNGFLDSFVRDRQLATTTLVTWGAGGAPSDGWSREIALSADGLTIAFASLATNLVSGDTNGVQDVFVVQ